jgi:NADPH-dependent 2,4-dienoyl-CoA reductase/sulfur reductase-like enzyme
MQKQQGKIVGIAQSEHPASIPEKCRQQNRRRKKRTSRSPEIIHADLVVVAAGDKPAITQANAVHSGAVSFKGILTSGNAGIPDLHHAVHAAGCNP